MNRVTAASRSVGAGKKGGEKRCGVGREGFAPLTDERNMDDGAERGMVPTGQRQTPQS